MDSKIAKRCLALDTTNGDRPKQGARRAFASRRLSLVFLSLCLMLAPLTAFAEDADAPGRITFVGKNGIATANGIFHRWKIIESQIDPDAIEKGHVVIEIDVASLDTDSKRRDDHLRTADFFEVARWPKARVRIHNAVLVEGGHYRAEFEIEIRDVTKTVSGDFEIVSRVPMTVRGDVTIDRTEFGVGTPKNWNPMSITNEIPLRFEITFSN